MAVGRKPKPTALHQLHGNPSKLAKKTLSHREPVVRVTLAAAPDWLDDDQQAVWDYALAHAPADVLKQIDQSVLACWVVAVNLHRKAVIAQQGLDLLMKAPVTGYPIQSPYLAIINRQALLIKSFAAELGFSPVARPRLGSGPGASPIDPRPAVAGVTVPLKTIDDYVNDDPTPAPTRH